MSWKVFCNGMMSNAGEREERRLQWERALRVAHEQMALLTSSAAGHMLACAFAERAIIRSWQVHTIHHHPGAGVSVGYNVVWDELRYRGTPAEYRQRDDVYVVVSSGEFFPRVPGGAGCSRLDGELAEIATGSLAQRTVRIVSGKHRFYVWVFPDDPLLPALARACDPQWLSALLGAPTYSELLSYRPMCRAVLRCEGREPARSNRLGVIGKNGGSHGGAHSGNSFFIKVIRPEETDEVVERTRIIAQGGVGCPQIVHVDPAGLIVAKEVAGQVLHKRYTKIGVNESKKLAEELFSALNLTLDGLPQELMSFPQRASWSARCGHYARLCLHALPHESARCRSIVQYIRRIRQHLDPAMLCPTHGDFYEANIFLDPLSWQVAGLVDLDMCGPGYRVDDWACLLGHLSVLPMLNPQYSHTRKLCQELFVLAGQHVGTEILAASCAGVVLSLAASSRERAGSAWRSQMRQCLDIAEKWIRYCE
ncbi:phosphotransferase [Trueperella sp. LYQ143]|uniref:phosphotransferase n=1 Tax=unclassified Trueperella TaxID=2630174 RepID=UPI0039835FAE